MVRRLLLAAVLVLAAVLAGPPAARADTVSTFTPGQSWTDTGGATLQLHGLGIIKVGATWYGFGENKVGGSAFQSISCYSSADLSHWAYQGAALTRQASGDLGPNRVVERPKVLFNAATGKYVMYLHIDDASYGEAEVGVATSDTPCGAYTYRQSFRPLGYQSRDIGLFSDTDGAGYLLTEDRASGLRIDRLSADYLSVTSSVALLGSYESPAMVKTGGRYYLLGSHLTGWSANDNVYASATSPAGPWSAFRSLAPVGTKTYTSQTANIIPVQGSAGTTYVYAGDRWISTDLGNSALIWLPLTIAGGTMTVGWQASWSLNVTRGTWTGTTNPADGTRRLTATHSGLRLDVTGAATADGARILQWTATSGTNQQWSLHRLTDTVYTLTGVGSGKCLEVPGGATNQGAALEIWTCNGGANQQWSLSATGSSFVLTNVLSGWVADVADESKTAGAAVDQWAANGGAHQTWSLS